MKPLLLIAALALPALRAAESAPVKAPLVLHPEKIDARLLDERELFRHAIDAGTTRAKSLDELATPISTSEHVPADFALPEWANKPLVLVVGDAKVDQDDHRMTIRAKDGKEVAFRLPAALQRPEAAKAFEKEIGATGSNADKTIAIYAVSGSEKLLLKVSQHASYEIPSPGPTPVPIVVPPGGTPPPPPSTNPAPGGPVKSGPNPKQN